MHKISFHQLTSAGDRACNQDYMLNKIDPNYSVFVLADGLGGHQAGEKASRFFCHSFIQYATKYAALINSAPKQTVEKWFNDAVAMMADAFQGDPLAYDAYTTCAILIITNTQVISAHCGDSRIYRINPKHIVWRTKDHSIPQKLFDEGALDEHKMGTHPEQNQLTKSINISNKFLPDIHVYPPAQRGETFILCSDGFWEFTKEHEFVALATAEMDRKNLLKQAKLAMFRASGRSDNVTVQWLRIE
ncbi:MAG: serine/threonine-protein phosphatase [Methyloprofundus sp.]|nr:serine/threonine-protein phosphatase [Methyloprofundus sp.]MDT8426594.1 serine/threonine-protein phosphatase [Methyloprofundus sp.]